MTLPPGCHLIPRVEVPLAEQRRILLDALRYARGLCRKDVIQALHEVEGERAAESMRGERHG